MQYLKIAISTLIIGVSIPSAYAGGLSEPVMENTVAPPPGATVPPTTTVTAPQVPYEPPRGSVNGGYLLLGAFVAMAAASATE